MRYINSHYITLSRRRKLENVLGQSIPDPRSRNVAGPTTNCRQSEYRHHQVAGAGRVGCPPTVYFVCIYFVCVCSVVKEKTVHGGHISRAHSPPPVSVTTPHLTAPHCSTGPAAEPRHCSVSVGTSVVASSGSATSAHESVKHRRLEQRSEALPAVSVGTVTSSAGLERCPAPNYVSVVNDCHNVDADSAAECSDMLSYDEQPDSPSVCSNAAQSDISWVDDGGDDYDDDDDDDAEVIDDDDIIVISSSSKDDDE